jgi:iron complex outermembrane receptor protein
LNFGLSQLQKDLALKPGSADVFGVDYAGNDPDYQVTLRSLMDVGRRTTLDVSMRAIDSLPSPAVPAYTAVDVRLNFRVTDNLEIGIGGYNLLDDSHVEFINPSLPASTFSRSFFASARWRH